jgi:hypothetical protein
MLLRKRRHYVKINNTTDNTACGFTMSEELKLATQFASHMNEILDIVMLCNNYCSYATVSDNKYFFVSGCVGVSVHPVPYHPLYGYSSFTMHFQVLQY